MAYHYPRQYPQSQHQYGDEGIYYEEPQQRQVIGAYSHRQHYASQENYESRQQGWVDQHQDFTGNNPSLRQRNFPNDCNGPNTGTSQQVDGHGIHRTQQTSGLGSRGIFLDSNINGICVFTVC